MHSEAGFGVRLPQQAAEGGVASRRCQGSLVVFLRDEHPRMAAWDPYSPLIVSFVCITNQNLGQAKAEINFVVLGLGEEER